MQLPIALPGRPDATITQSGNVATVNQPGIYTVTVTAANQCSSMATISVGGNSTAPNAGLSKSSDLSCMVQTVTLTATPSTGVSYSFAGPGVVSQSPTSTIATVNQPGTYTVTVTTGTSCTATATVTVGGNTTGQSSQITAQPVSGSTVCAGANVSAVVNATGTNLTYQWYKGGVADANKVAGATASMLTLTGVGTSQSGSYVCVVTGDCGSVTSAAFVVSVNSAPVITTQPAASSMGCPQGSATVSVVATGGNLTYQWHYNGGKKPVLVGGNSASLTLTNIDDDKTGKYTCTITNPCGTVTSAAFTLSISSDVDITTKLPKNMVACATTTVTIAIQATGNGLTYQWFKGGTAVAGANSPTLTLTNVGAGNAGSYTCQVTDGCGRQDISDETNLIIKAATSVSAPSTAAATVKPGDDITASVTATGSNLKYQWYKDGTANNDKVGGQNSATLALKNVKASHAGSYSCVVTSDCGSVTSSAFVLTVSNVGARQGLTAEAPAPLQVAVYPNPAVSNTVWVQIQGAAQQSVRLELVDLNGRVAAEHTVEVQTQQHTEQLDISRSPVGLLLLRVSTPEQSQVKKLIKQ